MGIKISTFILSKYIIIISCSQTSDNKSATSVIHEHVQHEQTKHVDMNQHFIKRQYQIRHYMLSLHQVIKECFTKGIPIIQFLKFMGKLGMMDPQACLRESIVGVNE